MSTLKPENSARLLLRVIPRGPMALSARRYVERLNLRLKFAIAARCIGMDFSYYGVEAMSKPESFPIDKIYVPVKRKKALKPELVQEIAESILEIGQQAPILVRPDEGRFVLVEGLHRFEACKALGEKTIIGVLVSAEIVHRKTLLSDSA